MSSRLKQNKSIGSNIKKLRKQAGLTQEQPSAQLQALGAAITSEIMAK